MKFKKLTAIAFTAMAIYSCDEGTATLGGSLTNDNDELSVTEEQFNVLTSSFVPDSVYSYSEECYLGKARDPETSTFVGCNFMTQFNMMEMTHLPSIDGMLSKEDGKVVADSCVILLFFDDSKYYGDSLASIKVKVSELNRPVEDGIHYTNFDPKASGFIREDGMKFYKTISMVDMNSTEDLGIYYVRMRLNQPYTDKNGVTYKDYGTYILRNYYEHPEYFKNSYAFVNNICPGFYFETIDGMGMISKFNYVQLRTYYRYLKEDNSEAASSLVAASTEEVLQSITVNNDMDALRSLASDNSCTYLKTPAGIFTEVTLPVDEIKANHPKDSLLSATVAFNRLNNQEKLTEYTFDTPKKMLLIQKDSLQNFFEQSRNYNNQYALYTTLNKNAYSFSGSSDISNLIVKMHNDKQMGLRNDPNWVAKHPNWNKALLIPVSEIKSTTSSGSTTTSSTVIGLVHEMGLTSTRLVKGTEESPIKMKVIYAKFND